MTGPQWSGVDDETTSLLTLVASEGHPSADWEWDLFQLAVRQIARANQGHVSQNALRPLIRGQVAPKRVGAFYHRACAQGLLVATGQWEVSDDRVGRNAGRPMRTYLAPEFAEQVAS